MISTFSKPGKRGYNSEEVARKMEAVNEAHGVWAIGSKWRRAKKIPDPRGGWMVEIRTR